MCILSSSHPFDIHALPLCMHCIIRMQRSLAMKKLSARPSVKRVDCDKTKESSAPIFICSIAITYGMEQII